MLRTLFKLNGPASLFVAFQLAFMTELYITGWGFDEVSDTAKAMAFQWGVAIQTGMALTQYAISDISSTEDLIKFGKIHALWWSWCGAVCACVMPKVTAFGLANVAFMFAYGGAYAY